MKYFSSTFQEYITKCSKFNLHNNMKEKLYCANKKIGRDVPEAEQYDKKYKCEV